MRVAALQLTAITTGGNDTTSFHSIPATTVGRTTQLTTINTTTVVLYVYILKIIAVHGLYYTTISGRRSREIYDYCNNAWCPVEPNHPGCMTQISTTPSPTHSGTDRIYCKMYPNGPAT